ncbi:MAG: bifunctional oligoribonuclease/PAP phosphatase NrnA [Candidatus Margulisbacteria bacterium]|nr:bifunctional oligoribonuclease/PAP phosphatase NrnA [Candidatus Margulisiibacteriota bacterium]
MKAELEKIKELLKSAKSAVIAAHIDPDGDTIGSMLALGMMLEQKGLSITLYCADQNPKIYKFLPTADRIKHELPAGAHYDLGFAVDASDASRIGSRIDLKKTAGAVINIDHHPDNTKYGDVNYVARVSSVAELIFDLGKYLKIKMDKNIADCLYTAMITDTGNFRYENTNVKTFMIAAELLKAGVNTHELTTRIYDNKSIPSIKISARALANIKFTPDHKIAWTAVTDDMMRETKAEGEDLIGIVDKLRSIEGVEVAIFFREKGNETKINFRSKDRINVSEIARRFGGGGHIKAAGAVVKGELAKIEDAVVAEAIKYLKASAYLV